MSKRRPSRLRASRVSFLPSRKTVRPTITSSVSPSRFLCIDGDVISREDTPPVLSSRPGASLPKTRRDGRIGHDDVSLVDHRGGTRTVFLFPAGENTVTRVFPQHRSSQKPQTLSILYPAIYLSPSLFLSLSGGSRFLFFFRHGRLCFLSIIKSGARLCFGIPPLSK